MVVAGVGKEVCFGCTGDLALERDRGTWISGVQARDEFFYRFCVELVTYGLVACIVFWVVRAPEPDPRLPQQVCKHANLVNRAVRHLACRPCCHSMKLR